MFVPKSDGVLITKSDFRRPKAMKETEFIPVEDTKNAMDRKASLDLTDGFFHVRFEEDYRPLTAVRTLFEFFHGTKLPPGLKNSSTTLQRIFNEI